MGTELYEEFQKGLQSFMQGEHVAAEKIFMDILDVSPGFKDVYVYLGYIWYQREEWKTANEYFYEAVKLKPHNYFLIYYLANTYMLLCKFEAA